MPLIYSIRDSWASRVLDPVIVAIAAKIARVLGPARQSSRSRQIPRSVAPARSTVSRRVRRYRIDPRPASIGRDRRPRLDAELLREAHRVLDAQDRERRERTIARRKTGQVMRRHRKGFARDLARMNPRVPSFVALSAPLLIRRDRLGLPMADDERAVDEIFFGDAA